MSDDCRTTPDQCVDLARQHLQAQCDALNVLSDALSGAFADAVELIRESSQAMVVTGIGKSGIIARKAAATLASTGTPAIFMHPVEGLHGDLGAVPPGAVLLALSKSGETEELNKFVHHFRRIGGRVIAVCELPSSQLAQLADVHLALPKIP
ncbi:MAG: SIS domain-containing protein, partial [Phycisphaerales bacterium]|nr:SIS domain-containing protein [Phycisphaerales bacterium]